MNKNFLYKFFKHVVDQAILWLSQRLLPLEGEKLVGLLPVARFSPKLPVNFKQLPTNFSRFFKEEINLPAVHVFTLRKVSVSWHMLVFNNLKIFQPALSTPKEEIHFQDSYLLKQWTGQTVQAPASQTIALVHDQWTAGNYYHWMVDSLTRLLLLKEHFPNAVLIMPEPVPAYVQVSASLLGYNDFLSLKKTQVLEAPLLVVPEHTTPPGFHHPVQLPKVRAALLQALGVEDLLPTPTRRVYVSRSKQINRHLRNEAEAQSILTHYGFETIYFEGLSLEQQVRLMLETEILLGVHGANLTNLLFLQPTAKVIELINEEKFFALGNSNFENLIYYRMSSCMGLSYFVLPCQNVPDQLPSNYSDVLVDLVALEQILTQL